jgi:tetratricopeptide (TPR) repeat protein
LEPDTSEFAYTKSRELSRQAGDERGVAEAVFRLGYVASSRGDVQRARRLFQESLQGFQSLGDDVGALQVLGDWGSLELEHGEAERGRELCETSLGMARAIGWVWYEARLLATLGEAAYDAGRVHEGERLLREALAASSSIGDRRRTVYYLAALARVAAERGDDERATTLWAAAEAEQERAPLAIWPLIDDSYAAHIPDAPRPAQALALDQAVEYALAED